MARRRRTPEASEEKREARRDSTDRTQASWGVVAGTGRLGEVEVHRSKDEVVEESPGPEQSRSATGRILGASASSIQEGLP